MTGFYFTYTSSGPAANLRLVWPTWNYEGGRGEVLFFLQSTSLQGQPRTCGWLGPLGTTREAAGRCCFFFSLRLPRASRKLAVGLAHPELRGSCGGGGVDFVFATSAEAFLSFGSSSFVWLVAVPN